MVDILWILIQLVSPMTMIVLFKEKTRTLTVLLGTETGKKKRTLLSHP